MKRWTCINCGLTENLNIYPDCCSSCGGSMHCDEGRTTNGTGEVRAEDVYELRLAAAEGDREATVLLWQDQASKGSYDLSLVADLMLQNRIDMMQAIYREAA